MIENLKYLYFNNSLPFSNVLGVKYFSEKISSLAGLKKNFSIFRKSTEFGHLWLPGSTFKVNFLNVKAKFQ